MGMETELFNSLSWEALLKFEIQTITSFVFLVYKTNTEERKVTLDPGNLVTKAIDII